jgi:hypothetical protein
MSAQKKFTCHWLIADPQVERRVQRGGRDLLPTVVRHHDEQRGGIEHWEHLPRGDVVLGLPPHGRHRLYAGHAHLNSSFLERRDHVVQLLERLHLPGLLVSAVALGGLLCPE